MRTPLTIMRCRAFRPARGLLLAAGMCLLATAAFGSEIYQWIDENGVRRYSNQPPPEGVEVIRRTQETPYDEAADTARRERDAAMMEEIMERQQKEQEAAEALAREKELERLRKEKEAQEDRIRQLEKENARLERENRLWPIYRPLPGPARPVPLPSGGTTK